MTEAFYYRGTTHELMKSVLNDLQEAARHGPARDSYFRRALAGLVGINDRQLEAGTVAPEALEEFWRDVYNRLLGLLDELSAFIRVLIVRAEDGADQWYELCIFRSAIQLLLDTYADTAIADTINDSDIAALDSALRERGLEEGPVREAIVPKGLPDTHWWWKYPQPTEGQE